MFIRKCSIQLIRDVSGKTPSSVRMFQPLGQNQTFTVHARPMMHLLLKISQKDVLLNKKKQMCVSLDIHESYNKLVKI